MNAYALLLASVAPEPHRTKLRADLARIARILIDRFWSEELGLFRGSLHDPLESGLGSRHTDFGHTIKALWMIERTGALLGDAKLSSWARERMPKVLSRAYLPRYGCWASGLRRDGSLDVGRHLVDRGRAGPGRRDARALRPPVHRLPREDVRPAGSTASSTGRTARSGAGSTSTTRRAAVPSSTSGRTATTRPSTRSSRTSRRRSSTAGPRRSTSPSRDAARGRAPALLLRGGADRRRRERARRPPGPPARHRDLPRPSLSPGPALLQPLATEGRSRRRRGGRGREPRYARDSADRERRTTLAIR